jgi:NADPH:quinone reductase-like Zn-dependent oxidoreductase
MTHCHPVYKGVVAQVIATGKYDLLRSLGMDFIATSRDPTLLLDEIKEMVSEQEKIHMVLNNLSRDYICQSIDLLVEVGRFVEIGKLGIWSEGEVPA